MRNKTARINVESLKEIEKYVGSESNPKFFFTMTQINKVGINPQSGYATPLGVYCYPLTREYYARLVDNTLPFAGRSPYVNVFTLSGGTFNMTRYSSSDLSRDTARLADIYDGWEGGESKIELDIYDDPIGFILNPKLTNEQASYAFNNAKEDYAMAKIEKELVQTIQAAYNYKIGHSTFDEFHSVEEAKDGWENGYISYPEFELFVYLAEHNLIKTQKENKPEEKPSLLGELPSLYEHLLDKMQKATTSNSIMKIQDEVDASAKSGKITDWQHKEIESIYSKKMNAIEAKSGFADDVNYAIGGEKNYSGDFIRKRDAAFDGAKFDTDICRMWNFTRILSGSAKNWNYLLRKLGYTNFYDPGTETIHPSEPTQAVILDPSIIILVASYHNPHGSKEYFYNGNKFQNQYGHKVSDEEFPDVDKQDINIIRQRQEQKQKGYSRIAFIKNPAILDRIAKNMGSNTQMLSLLLENDNIASETLTYLYNMYHEIIEKSGDLLRLFARNAHCPSKLKLAIFLSGTPLRQDDLSADELDTLYEMKGKDLPFYARSLISRHPEASQELLYRIFIDSLGDNKKNVILDSLIRNPSTSPKTLARITDIAIKEDDRDLKKNLLTRKTLPSQLAKRVRDSGGSLWETDLLESKSLPPKMIDKMLDNMHHLDGTIYTIINDTRTREKTLRKIVEKAISADDHDNLISITKAVLRSSNLTPDLTKYIMNNSRLPQNAMPDFAQIVLSNDRTSPEMIRSLLEKYNTSKAYIAAAQNPNTPESLLHEIAQEGGYEFYLIKNPSLPSDLMIQFAQKDKVPINRILTNPNVTNEIAEYLLTTATYSGDISDIIMSGKLSIPTLQKLTGHQNPSVSNRAERMLERMYEREQAKAASHVEERMLKTAKAFERRVSLTPNP